MSYQTSIHFDPTALLIIKNEVDSSILMVESAVSTLVEDETLPFGIDDALVQLEQCANVLALIDMPFLAKIAEYSAELMRKIMASPSNIVTQEVVALSEGTNMLKRYVEFICLREVKIPEFLLDTVNRLEIALGKPITPAGFRVQKLLGEITPDFNLPEAPTLEKSKYAHLLYKTSLSHLLKQEETDIDVQGFKIVGAYLADLSKSQPSKQYWNLVYYTFDHFEDLCINDSRLRILIDIESNIRQYLETPDRFKANLTDLANILSLAISREDNVSQGIRSQLNIGDEVLTDTQLQVFSRHLYGPDFGTIHTVVELLTSEMNQVRNEIEYQYQTMTSDKVVALKSKLQEIISVFRVLNLDESQQQLQKHTDALETADIIKDEKFAQELMNAILSATNALGVLERHHTSGRLQHRVNNTNISLDRLDEAHSALLNETKLVIDQTIEVLKEHLEVKNIALLENLPAKLLEVAGALLFLNVETGQKALKNSAQFIEDQFKAEMPLNDQHINYIYDTLASAEMLIDNLKGNQPVLHSMFNVALSSSEKLNAVA
jgi:hypothetical protein